MATSSRIDPKAGPATLSFKADNALALALRGIPNRSRFIRDAILIALKHICPMCGGTGVFTPNQRRHWQEFQKHHALQECRECRAVHLVCTAAKRRGGGRRGGGFAR